jgi:predicted RNase H-like nuclease
MSSKDRRACRVAGVDGCKGGWICVEWSGRCSLNVSFAPTLAELLERLDVDRVLVDIPIGLCDQGPDERQCDRAARRMLGQPRASSVFRAPCWDAVRASDYREASAVNYDRTGKRLSKQTFHLCAKIREVNELLVAHATSCSTVREVHPELCFRAFAGGRAMAHSKRRVEGRRERMQVLERRFPGLHVEDVLTEANEARIREHAQPDDVLDALAAACAARGRLATLPAEPPRDSRDLPMEIVVPVLRRTRRKRS